MCYTIYPIGDAAVTIQLSDVISEAANRKVIAMQLWLEENRDPSFLEITVAYGSLSVHYNVLQLKRRLPPTASAFDFVGKLLVSAFHESEEKKTTEQLIKIPVCYDVSLGLDLEYISLQKSLSIEEIVSLHTSRTYRVYMIGFLPGFPYMAEVDSKIAIARKPIPRYNVARGSVGIAGLQTGIYPMESPGGWQIVGRTPFRLFDPHGPELIAIDAGDQVQFFPISLEEFHQLNN